MSDQSRRNFMKTASLGAAAAGAAAALPTTSASAASPEPDSTAGTAAHNGPFAVWVKDAKTGHIAVLVGEQEVVHHDPALAQKLARIAGRGTAS